ncbi:MAG: glycosyltransferase [Candidatus Krumholzibacteriota bacterium]|nr:glycosyltransferase [Candidatus Krumholzibacteriota bacterium]
MKILLALSWAPWPVRRGTDRLMMNLAGGLAKGHEVFLVTMALDRAGLREVEDAAQTGVRVRAILAPNRRSALHRAAYRVRNAALRRLARVPRQTLYAAPPAFLDAVRRTARVEAIDAVIASYWHLYRLAGTTGAPIEALLTHDIDFRVHEERIARGLSTLPPGEAERRERIEREAYRRYRRIVTVTPRDAETLKELDETRGATILPLPLAMDLDRFRPGGGRRETDTILLLGSFDADFNRDALSFFARDVLPIVRRTRPTARLLVVGHHANGDLRREAGGGVEFAGGVPDIRLHLASCALMVLPLRFGGGVRIRMMEAAAMGTPVVSTGIGVGGMGLVPGREYLEANDPAAMAEAVVSLLDDGDLAARIGLGARNWAERTISMADYPERLDRMLDRLSENRPGDRA